MLLLQIVYLQDALLLLAYQQIVAWVDAVHLANAVEVVAPLIFVAKIHMHLVFQVTVELVVLHAVHAVLLVEMSVLPPVKA